jgi:predicted phage terminase large subunit-like protein
VSAGTIALDRYRRRADPNGRRRFATPGALARHCESATRQTPALDLIDQAAVDVMDGRVVKQQLAAPPQTGKSQRISRWTPLWMLTCDPRLRIAIVSAEKELAVRWGRQIKRDLEAHPELGLTLRQDSQAAGRWETAEGGGLFCTGIAAGTTGRPIDVLIIDDPIKDRAQAESKTMRERVWDFWENDAGARARKTILMSTRWHTADLAGQLLEKEPGQWSVLAIPAIAEAGDPLGRELGVELQSANPELHPPGYYHERQKLVSPYVWSSLFQQHPTAAEGGIFKRGDWQFWEHLDGGRLRLGGDVFGLGECPRYLTVDLATSLKTSADWTVATAWAITPSGDLVVLDRSRARVPEIDHAAFLAPLRQRWLGQFDAVHIESRMFGTRLVYALGEAGVPIAELHADVDKLTRALPYAGLVRQRRVWLPREVAWIDEWIDEHADFPKAAHDDQVDTGAYGARVAIDYWSPLDSDDVLTEEDLGYDRVSIGPSI